jgi:hypothetical protein
MCEMEMCEMEMRKMDMREMGSAASFAEVATA